MRDNATATKTATIEALKYITRYDGSKQGFGSAPEWIIDGNDAIINLSANSARALRHALTSTLNVGSSLSLDDMPAHLPKDRQTATLRIADIIEKSAPLISAKDDSAKTFAFNSAMTDQLFKETTMFRS